MVLSSLIWVLVALGAVALVGFAAFIYRQRQRKLKNADSFASKASAASPETADSVPFKISYVPSGNQWSGSNSGPLPLKTLTYKQYECLEDARYGFRIVGVTPTERKKEQPHKTRAHGKKTVESLLGHRFLISDDSGGYLITDHGLKALQVCAVRY